MDDPVENFPSCFLLYEAIPSLVNQWLNYHSLLMPSRIPMNCAPAGLQINETWLRASRSECVEKSKGNLLFSQYLWFLNRAVLNDMFVKWQHYPLLSASLASVARVSSACMLPNDDAMRVDAFYFCFVFLVLPLRLSFPFLLFFFPSSSSSLLVLVSFLFFPASLTLFSSLHPFSSFLSSFLSRSFSIHLLPFNVLLFLFFLFSSASFSYFTILSASSVRLFFLAFSFLFNSLSFFFSHLI